VGFHVPLGVYTAATLSLYRVTGFEAFAVAGMLFAVLLGGFWSVVLTQTLREVARGHLFYAPCLATAR
jgi:tellurite resistance protein TehA-like permease